MNPLPSLPAVSSPPSPSKWIRKQSQSVGKHIQQSGPQGKRVKGGPQPLTLSQGPKLPKDTKEESPEVKIPMYGLRKNSLKKTPALKINPRLTGKSWMASRVKRGQKSSKIEESLSTVSGFYTSRRTNQQTSPLYKNISLNPNIKGSKTLKQKAKKEFVITVNREESFGPVRKHSEALVSSRKVNNKSDFLAIPGKETGCTSSKEDILSSQVTVTSENETDSLSPDKTKKIMVRRRGQKQSTKSHSSFSTAVPREEADLTYLAEYFKALSQSTSSPANSQVSAKAESKLARIFDWLTHNHRVVQNMRFDSIVERGAPVSFFRRDPQKKLLLLDLDETLIHCTGDVSQREHFDMELDFINQEGVPLKGLLNVRPGVKKFLRTMSQHFEIAVFTASLKYYADRILRVIDPRKEWISHVFYRESCAKTKLEKLVKDLSIFQGVPIQDLIMVDNNYYCLWPQPENGIPILNFEFDREDSELERLTPLLISLAQMEDPTVLIRSHFRTHNLLGTPLLREFLSLFESN